MHVEKVATRASPKKLEVREHWKREKFAQRRHLMCCMHLCELQANTFCVSLVGVDRQQIVMKDCFISNGPAETQDSKRNAAKQHSMIPSLYLNNVFRDISPHLHRIVSVLGALGTSRALFCFVLCEGRRLECKTLL